MNLIQSKLVLVHTSFNAHFFLESMKFYSCIFYWLQKLNYTNIRVKSLWQENGTQMFLKSPEKRGNICDFLRKCSYFPFFWKHLRQEHLRDGGVELLAVQRRAPLP